MSRESSIALIEYFKEVRANYLEAHKAANDEWNRAHTALEALEKKGHSLVYRDLRKAINLKHRKAIRAAEKAVPKKLYDRANKILLWQQEVKSL